jgi:hypothetical protein
MRFRFLLGKSSIFQGKWAKMKLISKRLEKQMLAKRRTDPHGVDKMFYQIS